MILPVNINELAQRLYNDKEVYAVAAQDTHILGNRREITERRKFIEKTEYVVFQSNRAELGCPFGKLFHHEINHDLKDEHDTFDIRVRYDKI